jgi:hypothetical protein
MSEIGVLTDNMHAALQCYASEVGWRQIGVAYASYAQASWISYQPHVGITSAAQSQCRNEAMLSREHKTADKNRTDIEAEQFS